MRADGYNNNNNIASKSTRICFVAHSAGELGAETALIETIEALSKKGHKCHVLLPCYGPLIHRLESLGICYAIIGYKSWLYKKATLLRRIGRTIFNLLLLIPIMIQIKRWRCQVVYTNTIMVFVGGLAAKILGLPHIWHIHEFGQEDHGFKFDFGEHLCCRLMDLLSDLVICVSESIASKYKTYINHDKLKVVYQSVGVELDRRPCTSKPAGLEQTNSRLTCAIVGNLERGKRQEDAIMAINDIADQGIDAHLYIIGSGESEYKSHLMETVEKNGLEDRIFFLGYRKDFISVIKSVDIVLMCSMCEGFGRITVYGMLCGKPIIGTNSGSTPELVKDGYNGLLYEPGDRERLAAHIAYLHSNPQIMRNLGENGKKWADGQFSQKRYGLEMEKLVLGLINENDY